MHTTESPQPDPYDVVVVGGGAAGLSAALSLSRARRSVLVIDAGHPRNAPAGHVHNYLGREGTPPLELVAIGRDEVRSYGGEIVTDTVTSVSRDEGGRFRLECRSGPPVVARRILLATGLVDRLPDVPGLAERWGQDVLHCPYCHGWEVRDRTIAVLATNPMQVQQALMWRQWSADITLVLHTAPAPSAEEATSLAARGITVVAGPVAAVESDAQGRPGLRLADGTLVPADAIVVMAPMEANGDLLATFGVTTTEFAIGDRVLGTVVAADAMGATAVPGIFAAGNVTSPMDQVIVAAAAGGRVAGAVNQSLIDEDTAAAVAAFAEA